MPYPIKKNIKLVFTCRLLSLIDLSSGNKITNKLSMLLFPIAIYLGEIVCSNVN